MVAGAGVPRDGGRNVEVRPVGPADWDDLVTLFGTRGDPPRCWCQWFRLPAARWRQVSVAARRDSLRDEAEGPGRWLRPGPSGTASDRVAPAGPVRRRG